MLRPNLCLSLWCLHLYPGADSSRGEMRIKHWGIHLGINLKEQNQWQLWLLTLLLTELIVQTRRAVSETLQALLI